MLSVRSVAKQLETSVRSVYRMLADGLAYYDIPGGPKIDEADLQRYLESRPRPMPSLLEAKELLASAKPAHQKPCIYFLILAGEIVYVGQTTNLIKRLGRHLQDGKEFDSYSVVECEKRDLLRLEMAYISELKPRYNVMGIIEEVPE